jgi:hypothetical protein
LFTVTSRELECGCGDANKVPKTAATPPVLPNTPLLINNSSLGSLTLAVRAPLEVVLPAAAAAAAL